MTAAETAARVFVLTESIRVVDRHRKEVGDVSDLVASIADVGLLHPIVLTSDSRLIAGQRRLEACRQLGWTEVPVHFVDRADDASVLLRAERDENICRRDMLPSELASLGAALCSIEERRAAERMRNGQDRGRAAQHGLVLRTGTQDQLEEIGRAVDVVGPALGMAGRTYQELRFVHDTATDPATEPAVKALAEETLAEMDRTGSIAPPARRLRAKLRAKQDAQEAKEAALAASAATEAPAVERKARNNSAAERFAKLRELAAAGHTSAQIAGILGYASPETARNAAKEQGIDIPADAVMGRSRKTIDPNRVVRETVFALEDLVIGLGMVSLDNLDASQVGHWTGSLTESIRALNRLIRQMKEKIQ